jgi:hypothetical protein
MASDDKKAKANPAPKVEPPAAKTDATPAKEKVTDAPKATDATKSANATKSEGGETAAAAPKSYSRGEGQKPVSQAYKDNWNAIFGKKKTKKKKR